ncbi:MAG TPA: SLC45 family MFS transporter, partial [Clostridiaceae bacterium]|nr:SLC45 family MFS transporter [Clostridiaceae bacterium]
PLILKNTFNISDTIAGVLMAVDNILALFMLPLFGMLSDKTNTRFGKRTPYIVFGTLGASVGMLLIPYADNTKSLVLFLIALGIVLFSMSTYRSPAVALMPDVTPKPLRSKANAVINLMGAIGGIITLGVIAILVPKEDTPNYFNVFATIAGIMIVSITLLVIPINEKKLAEEMREEVYDKKENDKSGNTMPTEVKKSFIFLLFSVFLWFTGYNAITTAFSKYAQIYWRLKGGLFAYTLMVAQIAAILSYIPVGIIASRIGRKKTILFGIALLAIAFGAAIFYKTFYASLFFFFALAGIGWAAINVNSYPMVVEMSKGSDIGKYTGVYYTFSMSAQIITPILSGALLEHVGYWTLFPYGTFFVAASFATMLLVKHGDNKPVPPSTKLEAFDTAE